MYFIVVKLPYQPTVCMHTFCYDVTALAKYRVWLCNRTMAERSALKQIDEQLTCSVCLDQYTNPKTLPCMHYFCLKCIEGLQQELQVHVYTHIYVPTKRTNNSVGVVCSML